MIRSSLSYLDCHQTLVVGYDLRVSIGRRNIATRNISGRDPEMNMDSNKLESLLLQTADILELLIQPCTDSAVPPRSAQQKLIQNVSRL